MPPTVDAAVLLALSAGVIIGLACAVMLVGILFR